MRVILLSGGSGKRLWPLSNDTRSKQFLRLLEAPDGSSESMFQRMLRQLNDTGIAQSITIATSASQIDIISNQLLGREADVVTEPERRDTFPAIALSSAFLALEKGYGDDEVIVVVPCDAYTEKGYFDSIKTMVQAVKDNVAELVLMGICPTAPSTKFGYVVPKSQQKGGVALAVERFTEKPDSAKAKELIQQGAFWNGGVFAFRLGYLMNIVNKHIQVNSFTELRDRYAELPKISFDYEVAEKAQSVAVVPYKGKWKDLGTWNSMAEELPHPFSGYVVADETTSGTCIINELDDMPIISVGTKDMIVAASPDGILVCSKEASERQKPLVEQIKARPMYEERRWGTYRVIGNTTYPDGYRSLTKLLHLNAGKFISYQTHAKREEVWTFVDGEGLLVVNGEVRKVGRGDVVHIQPGMYHAIRALSELEFIEVQVGTELVEEDIQRYPWDWEKYL